MFLSTLKEAPLWGLNIIKEAHLEEASASYKNICNIFERSALMRKCMKCVLLFSGAVSTAILASGSEKNIYSRIFLEKINIVNKIISSIRLATLIKNRNTNLLAYLKIDILQIILMPIGLLIQNLFGLNKTDVTSTITEAMDHLHAFAVANKLQTVKSKEPLIGRFDFTIMLLHLIATRTFPILKGTKNSDTKESQLKSISRLTNFICTNALLYSFILSKSFAPKNSLIGTALSVSFATIIGSIINFQTTCSTKELRKVSKQNLSALSFVAMPSKTPTLDLPRFFSFIASNHFDYFDNISKFLAVLDRWLIPLIKSGLSELANMQIKK